MNMTDQEFAVLFERYMENKRNEMRDRYNRVLPSGELIFNRFDKGKYLHCGDSSSIYDTSVIMGDVEIGDHVWIGPYTLLEGANAPLRIGNYVTINSGVMIYTHDSTKHYVSGGKSPFDKGPVTIGNYTVIGTQSMVSCNVQIGEHCIVAAQSFVNRDIPDFSIAAGTPARIIGRVLIQESGAVDFDFSDKSLEQEVKISKN